MKLSISIAITKNSWMAALLTLQVRTLGETVRLDARTKLLNPKWYEGMLGSGYEGVREIQKRLTNTMGWSATSGMVRGDLLRLPVHLLLPWAVACRNWVVRGC